jgi:chemotaxis signal transduction protein
MATGEMRPESDRRAYVAGMLTVGEESIDVLDLEALLASASTEARS